MEEAFFQNGAEDAPPKPEIEIDARMTLSDIEVLSQKDFAQMSAAEIAEARRKMHELILPSDAVKTRRFRADPGGKQVDMRATLKASARQGGLIRLQYKAPKEVHPPLVVLCDISGSMNQYTQVMLHFVHAVMEKRRHVHAFAFGTRLTNISRALRTKDPDEALAACSSGVKDWSGGTRIGTSLHLFNRQWGRRVLSGGAVVLLVTDGLEREGTEQLAFEMDRLHRSCRRLIWLNPLLRFDGFEARARGIKAMLPHVDEFRTIHNLAAVADIAAALDARRPAREADPRRFVIAA